MTTVVQVSFHLDRSGREPGTLLDAWPTLSHCAIAAHRAGVDLAVVQAAGCDAELIRDGVTFHFVREAAGRRRGTPGTRPVARRPDRLARVVRSLEPRVLHVHGLGLPGHAAWLKAQSRAERLLVQDHADRPPRPWRRPGARRSMRAIDGVAFTARAQAEPFFATALFSQGLQIHELIESSSSFSPGDMAEARRVTGIHGSPCGLWLGRLDRNKDPMTVLDGFAMAAPALADPHLWMCSLGGPLEAAVRRRVQRDPVLSERVHLIGARRHEEVEHLLRAADYMVQGSHREGSGYALIEAMACGTIPVITRIPPFLKIAGDTGFYWPPGDAAQLATGIASIELTDLCRRRERVRNRFDRALSWNALGRDLARTYSALLGQTTLDDPTAHTVSQTLRVPTARPGDDVEDR